jgi:SAM-dependent methyltransferase
LSGSARDWLHDRLDLSYRAWLRLMTDELAPCSTVLDVGCGKRSPLERVPGAYRSTGVDAHAPALAASRAAGIHDEYLERDVRALDLPDRSFDAVVMLDLIEHLRRDEATDLLAQAERIARKVVILTTPNGFLPQSAYEGNDLQAHRSGWTAPDLEAAGYTVYGMNGLKPLRGELSYPRRPRFVTRPLSLLSQPFVWRAPRLAFELLAVNRPAATAAAPPASGPAPGLAGRS